MKNLYLLALAVSIAGLTSCKLDPNWDVDVLAPIAQTQLTPGNLLGDSNLVVQPGGSLVFDYQTTVFDFPADSILRLPDSTYSYSFVAPFNFTVNPGFPLQVYNNYLLFNLPDIGLSEAHIQNGRLKVEIVSTATQPAILNFEIPKAKKDGSVFSFSDNLAAAPAGGHSVYRKEFDISGYGIDFSGDNADLYNKLRLVITATIASDAQPFPVTVNQEIIRANISFADVRPDYARGRVSTRSVNISSAVLKLPFFDMIKSGTVDIDQADLTLTAENGFGIEARCLFTNLNGTNTRTGVSVALNHALIGSAININAASTNQNPPPYFQPSSYVGHITTANSNLENFAVNFPDRITVDGSFTVNPNGDLSAGNDFVFGASSAKIKLGVVAPLTFSADNLLLVDTVQFNGASLKKNNPIKSGHLKIYAENKFPFECGIQLLAVDSAGNIAWSQQAEQLVAAGVAQADGRVYQSTPSILTLALSAADFESLSHAKRIAFRLRFHTLPTAQLMKIYHDYTLGLKVIAEVKAGI